MRKTFDVVSFGHALVDVQAHVDDAFISRLGLKKNDMQLVTPAQAGWLFNQMPPAVVSPGGSGANSMSIVAALGGRSGFMGRIGDDQFGNVLQHHLKAQGVCFKPNPLNMRKGAETGRCLILVTPDGQRTMNTCLGVSAEAGLSDLDGDMIRSARILLVEGYMFDSPATRHATEAAIDIAKSAGTKVAFTLSSESCIERNRAIFRPLVQSKVDILLANEAECLAFYETGNYELARLMVRRDCPLAVVTRGKDGANIFSGNGTAGIKAVSGVNVVDTTGAGDAFAGGLLYGLAQGFSPTKSGRIAALCSAEVISHMGAQPQADLKAFVEQGLAQRQATRSARAKSHTPQ